FDFLDYETVLVEVGKLPRVEAQQAFQAKELLARVDFDQRVAERPGRGVLLEQRQQRVDLASDAAGDFLVGGAGKGRPRKDAQLSDRTGIVLFLDRVGTRREHPGARRENETKPKKHLAHGGLIPQHRRASNYGRPASMIRPTPSSRDTTPTERYPVRLRTYSTATSRGSTRSMSRSFFNSENVLASWRFSFAIDSLSTESS